MYKRVDNQNQINLLLKDLSLEKSVPILVNYDNKQYFGDISIDKNHTPSIQFTNQDELFKSDDLLEITFFYKDVSYNFETKVISQKGHTYLIDKPSLLIISSKRAVNRYKVKSDEAICIRFPDQDKEYALKDISIRGASFTSEEIFLFEGQTIRNAIIKLSPELEVYADVCVRYSKIKDYKCNYGLSFTDMDWKSFYEIFLYIQAKQYPNLQTLSQFSKEELYQLFNETGYFDRVSSENSIEMNNSFNALYQVFQKTKGKIHIIHDLALCKDDILHSGCIALRIYSHTFIGHYLIQRSNLNTKLDCHSGIANALIANPCFKYYLTYIHAHQDWNEKVFVKLGEILNDDSKFILENMFLFECNIHSLKKQVNMGEEYCEVLDNPKPFLEYCKKQLPPLEADCFDYTEETFQLSELKSLYGILGLSVGRRIWQIKKYDDVIAYVVAEAYENGLSFLNHIDMCRIYFLKKNVSAESLMKTILPNVSTFFERYRKKNFYMILKNIQIPIESLHVEGLKYISSIGQVILSRDGLKEYIEILKD